MRRFKSAVKCPLSTRRPQAETAASKAWPEADDDGGRSTVLVRERLRINSSTADDDEWLKAASAASRFCCRTMKSVKGSAPAFDAGALPGKRFFTCVSAPHVNAAEFCRAWPAIIWSSRSQPGNASNRAACTSIWAVPNFCSPASVFPSSSSAGPVRPALARMPASTARKCTGTSRPQASSANPRTAQNKKHSHRIFMISPENSLSLGIRPGIGKCRSKQKSCQPAGLSRVFTRTSGIRWGRGLPPCRRGKCQK